MQSPGPHGYASAANLGLPSHPPPRTTGLPWIRGSWLQAAAEAPHISDAHGIDHGTCWWCNFQLLTRLLTNHQKIFQLTGDEMMHWMEFNRIQKRRESTKRNFKKPWSAGCHFHLCGRNAVETPSSFEHYPRPYCLFLAMKDKCNENPFKSS